MNVNFDFFALFLRKTISRNFILCFLGQSHHNKTLLLFTFNGWCSKCKTPKQRTKQLWMYLFFFRFCSALTNNSCLHQWNRINFSFVFILGFFVSVISCLVLWFTILVVSILFFWIISQCNDRATPISKYHHSNITCIDDKQKQRIIMTFVINDPMKMT